MDCDETADLIDAYVDGELTAPQHAAVARHLGGCPACASAIAAREALRSRIRDAGGHLLPDGLAERVSVALTDADTRGGSMRLVNRHPWWLLGSHAAAAAIGALALFFWLSDGGMKSVTSDVLSAHLRSLAAEQIGPVASSQSHTVRPWFAGKIDFSPPVADLSSAGFPLLGGHVDYVGGRPAAALAYGRRLHRITLFIVPLTETPRGTPATNQLGYQIVSWRDPTFAYWAISDLNRAELTDFQRNFQMMAEQPTAPE
jgi:anti-sigma factor RsiW